MKSKAGALGFMLVLLVALAPTSARAASFALDTVFSGNTPSGAAPWLTASTSCSGLCSLSGVTLTLNSHLATGEFVTEWNFNLNPTLDPTKLTVTYVSGQTGEVATGLNSFKADGDGFFDISFSFPSSGDRFTGIEQSVWLLTYDGLGLNANSFNFGSVNSGGNGTYASAAHIQGIGTDGCSGWIGDLSSGTSGGGSEGPCGGGGGGDPTVVPEPGTLLLLGSGLAGLAALRRRQQSA